METGLDILAWFVESPEIHIEQVGGAVDVEGACGNAIAGVIDNVFISIARACYHEQYIVGTHFSFNLADEVGQQTIELDVYTLHVYQPVGSMLAFGR